MKKILVIFLFLVSFFNLFASHISEKILIETVEMLKKERKLPEVFYIVENSEITLLDKHKIPELLQRLRDGRIKKDTDLLQFFYGNEKFNQFYYYGGLYLSPYVKGYLTASYPGIKFLSSFKSLVFESCKEMAGNMENKFVKVGSIDLGDAVFINSKEIFVYFNIIEADKAIIVKKLNEIKVVNFGEIASCRLFCVFIKNGKDIVLKEKYFIRME